MLSILIPVFNFDIRELVAALRKQAIKLNIDFEIRCYDDASNQNFSQLNKTVASFDKVIFQRLEKNIGRSAIRNKLAADAAFDNLLFMDCDSKLPDDDFLKKYIEKTDHQSIIYGGRSYETQPPTDHKKYLRWKYGIGREAIPFAIRVKNPYDSFMTNNFLVPKKTFLKIGLDEAMKGYGHEDTKFGYMLLLQHIPIIHINNPLIHIGLEDTDEFLEKTNEGLKNLLYLYRQQHIPLSHLRSIRLLRYFNFLNRSGTRKAFLFVYQMMSATVEKNLNSGNAKLFYFDLYRLGKFTELSLRSNNE